MDFFAAQDRARRKTFQLVMLFAIAIAGLIVATNLLIAEGSLTAIAGIGAVVVGMFPLVFTDAPPSDEEYAEQLVIIFGGLVGLLWGSLVCMGASKMQNLESYSWAIVGSVMGFFPLLAGIFAIVTLRDPRVIAGFQEMEYALDEDEDELDARGPGLDLEGPQVEPLAGEGDLGLDRREPLGLDAGLPIEVGAGLAAAQQVLAQAVPQAAVV